MQCRVVVRTRNPSGEDTPPAVWYRTNASWTASSASATLPSIRYVTDIIRGRRRFTSLIMGSSGRQPLQPAGEEPEHPLRPGVGRPPQLRPVIHRVLARGLEGLLDRHPGRGRGPDRPGE